MPCSGLGVLRKKPEIRYKDPKELEDLPQIQGEILANVAGYVRPGGVLLYSTCTLRREENEEVVQAFLAGHREFHREAFRLPGPLGLVEAGECTLWPQRLETDGFFLARLRKEGAQWTDFKSMTPEELAAWCKGPGPARLPGQAVVPVAPPGGDLHGGDDRPAQGFPGRHRPGGGRALPHGGQKTGLKAGRHHKISLEACRRQLH